MIWMESKWGNDWDGSKRGHGGPSPVDFTGALGSQVASWPQGLLEPPGPRSPQETGGPQQWGPPGAPRTPGVLSPI